MLPSLALGTPVLFINDILDDDDVRFSGLSNLAHNLRTEEYVTNPLKFDINKPPKNKDEYLKIRKSLEKSVEKFTGHIGSGSYLTLEMQELIHDANFIQAAIGGASELGDLREEIDKLKISLGYKENHVLELAEELRVERERYNSIARSLPWRVAKKLRVVEKLPKRNSKRSNDNGE